MATRSTDKLALLTEQSNMPAKSANIKAAKRNKLLLRIFIMLTVIAVGVIMILGFVISDSISSSKKGSDASTICGTIESKAVISDIFNEIYVLNNVLWETGGADYDKWFDFYYHAVTDDFTYSGTQYMNNNTILGSVQWNSKEEFFINTGNPDSGIPPSEELFQRIVIPNVGKMIPHLLKEYNIRLFMLLIKRHWNQILYSIELIHKLCIIQLKEDG